MIYAVESVNASNVPKVHTVAPWRGPSSKEVERSWRSHPSRSRKRYGRFHKRPVHVAINWASSANASGLVDTVCQRTSRRA